MEKSYYESPIGILEIICENNELVYLKLVDRIEKPFIENDFINSLKFQLDEYFECIRKNFDIKINPKGTIFQRKVWSELQKIPYGQIKSYSDIADCIGNKNAQRAVGSACNKNPVMIIIPCHRVLAKNGNLGGFAYGNNVKQKLLEIENCTDR